MGSLRFRRFKKKKKKKVPTGSEYQLPVWPICDQQAAETSLSSILSGAQTENILGSTERPRGRKGPSQGGCRASPRDSQEDRPSQSPRAGAPRRARSLQWGATSISITSPPPPTSPKSGHKGDKHGGNSCPRERNAHPVGSGCGKERT